MASDASGINDSAEVTLNASPPPDPDANGPADFHGLLTKDVNGWSWRVTDRWDNPVDISTVAYGLKADATAALKAATKELDGVVDIQTYTPWPEGTDQ
jgi:hypothetical protein